MSDFSIENGLRLLVDAEYTYMNDGISLMALGMMCHYNKSKAYVGNTYQCYLKVGLIKTKDTIYAKLALMPWIDGNLGHTLSVLTQIGNIIAKIFWKQFYLPLCYRFPP